MAKAPPKPTPTPTPQPKPIPVPVPVPPPPTTQTTQPPFTNPYSGLLKTTAYGDQGKAIRASVDVLKDDHFAIRLVLADFGATQVILGKTIRHLANHVRNNNLTFADKNEFAKYINQLFSESTDATTGN